MYGPLWLFITMLVEFLILGHVSKLLIAAPPADDLLNQVAAKYGLSVLDPGAASANESLHKIVKMTFLLSVWYFGVPLTMFVTLRSQNSGTLPLSYAQLLQIYAYSLTVFIPVAALHTLFWPYSRFRWLLLIGAVALSSYY
jgi:hypothetical protein